MTRYIEAHKDQYGVEPICRVLEIAPSTYYAALSRPPCARQVRDEQLKPEVARVHKENFSVYGVHKVWRQLNREGLGVGRDRVGRLMAKLQLAGIRRGRVKRTTFPGEAGERAQDLVERAFVAVAPNRLWVADLTYVSTWSGFCYVAFVVDAFSRRIVGWRVAATLHAELALGASEMAIWSRRSDDLSSLVHHSDPGHPVPGHPLHGTPGRGSRTRGMTMCSPGQPPSAVRVVACA
jgi:putative transposase